MKFQVVPSINADIYVEYSGNQFEKTNKDKRDTIIFVHGYPDYLGFWSNQLHDLKDNYHVAAFDLRGVHKSTAPTDKADYSMDKLMVDLEAVINFMVGSDGKVHLVGHDWGAMICWCFASNSEYKKRILSYTAIACPHPAIAVNTSVQRIKKLHLGEVWNVFKQLSKSYYIWLFQVPHFAERMWKTFPQLIWRQIHRDGSLAEDDEIFEMTTDEILSIAINPINMYRQIVQGKKLHLPGKKIEIPVSLIIPLNDMVLTPEIYHNTSEYVENLEIHHLSANHWVQREKADLVTSLIRKFVSK